MFKKMKARIAELERESRLSKGLIDCALQRAHAARTTAEGTWSRIDGIEEVLGAAGLISLDLYHLPGKSNIDIAALAAKVDAMGKLLGMVWLEPPKAEAVERPSSLVVALANALDVLVDVSAMLNVAGHDHRIIDAAMNEIAEIVGELCST